MKLNKKKIDIFYLIHSKKILEENLFDQILILIISFTLIHPLSIYLNPVYLHKVYSRKKLIEASKISSSQTDLYTPIKSIITQKEANKYKNYILKYDFKICQYF